VRRSISRRWKRVGSGVRRRRTGRAVSGHDLDIALDLSNPDIRGVRLESLDASIRSRGERTEIDRLSVTGLYGARCRRRAASTARRTAPMAAVDATVVAGDGARADRRARRAFPGCRRAGDAERDRGAQQRRRSPTRGSISSARWRAKTRLAGEASLSVSGVTGGTELSVTSTARATRQPGRGALLLNASLDNAQGERILQQLAGGDLLHRQRRALRVGANFDGSLFDGMKTVVTLAATTICWAWHHHVGHPVDGLHRQAQVESGDIEPWLMALGYGLPGMGLGTTTDLSAAVSWRGGKAVLHDLDAVLNGNRITGDLTVDAGGDTPAVRGDSPSNISMPAQLYAIVTGDAASAMLAGEGDEALSASSARRCWPDTTSRSP
jgi:hypothetical protein